MSTSAWQSQPTRALTVPVLHRLQGAPITDIAALRKDVVSKARTGKLSMRDISDGTFTVSNLGMLGIDQFDAILNPPQVAILRRRQYRRDTHRGERRGPDQAVGIIHSHL
jgi:pyruvate/2-oxoglutarate dehydrogenase complex dihydrolipoamide acyltransferase (E2) component